MKKQLTFNDELGKLLDQVIVSLSEISKDLTEFANKCTVKGYVPPHPSDLFRATHKLASDKNDTKDAVVLVNNSHNPPFEIPSYLIRSFKSVISQNKNPYHLSAIKKLKDVCNDQYSKDQIKSMIQYLIASGQAEPKK